MEATLKRYRIIRFAISALLALSILGMIWIGMEVIDRFDQVNAGLDRFIEQSGAGSREVETLKQAAANGRSRLTLGWAFFPILALAGFAALWFLGRLSREISVRMRAETELGKHRRDLEIQIAQRTTALSFANVNLTEELEQRKRAEEEVHQTRERLHTAIQSMDHGFALYDQEDRLLLFNDKFSQLFAPVKELIQSGTPFEKILKTGVERGLFPKAVNDPDAWYERQLAQHREAAQEHECHLAPDRWIRVSEHKTADGGRVGIWVEITKLRRAMEELRDAKERADAANRAKSEFLSRMSHELRTPLNAIIGFSQLLESDPEEPLSTDQKESVEQITGAGRHLLAMIDEIIDLSKIEAGGTALTIAPVDPQEVFSEGLAFVQPLADEADVILDDRTGDENLPQVIADHTRFRQVLLNLLTNAVKYNRVGGSVTLSWEVVETDEEARLRTRVTDDGVGIPVERQGELFQAFNRLGAEYTAVEGAGIGLAFSKRLVEMMNGEIGFESDEGKGSLFWFDLPTAPTETAADTPPPPEQD